MLMETAAHLYFSCFRNSFAWLPCETAWRYCLCATTLLYRFAWLLPNFLRMNMNMSSLTSTIDLHF